MRLNKKGISAAAVQAADESKAKQIGLSKIHTNCFSNAALTINHLRNNDLDTLTVMSELRASAERINDGITQEVEQMLMTQAKVLEDFFHKTLNKLMGIDVMKNAAIIADIALRAQNQSRKTLIALAEIKNPRRATFIKQQNNAVNQQVNNSIKSKSEKIKKVANELLEVKNEQRLGTRTTASPITDNSQVETVEICRSEDT